MYWGRAEEFITYRNVLSVIYNGAIAAGLVYAQEDAVGIYTDSYLIRVKEHEVPFRVNLFLKTGAGESDFMKSIRVNTRLSGKMGFVKMISFFPLQSMVALTGLLWSP